MVKPEDKLGHDAAVDAVLDAIIDLPTVERLPAAQKLCAGRDTVWAEVESILRADAAAGEFLNTPGPSGGAGRQPLEPPARIGERIGAWEVSAYIGRGGMGEVLEVRRADGQYEQRAALKRLHDEASADQIERLQRERQILAALRHPNIAALLDGGLDDSGRPWMVMEYVEGEQLDRWARNATLEQRLTVFKQLCQALGHAHAHLVVHRDLKPANVIVDRQGRARLLDFGIAKLIRALRDGEQTQTLATPNYAAPEQLLGEGITVQTDIYGLGATLYFLLCDSPPLELDGVSLPRLVDQVRHLRPQPPSRIDPQVPADLDAICLRCLDKDPARRYRSVDELLLDLERYQNGFPVLARKPGRLDHLRSFVRRHRYASAAALVFALTIVFGMLAISVQARHALEERDLARREAARLQGLRNAVLSLFRTAADSGERLSARELFARSATRAEAEFNNDPATTGALLQMLGSLHLHNEDYPAARALLDKVLQLPQDALAPVVYADAHMDLAHLAFRDRDFDKTRQHLLAAESTWAHAPHLYRAESMQSATLRAQLARAEGRMQEAVQILARAAAEARRHWGEMHPETATVLVNLAATQYYAGAIDDAIATSGRTFEIYRALQQEQSPDALNLLANWGLYALRAGRPREAEQRLSEALELRTRLYGASAAQAILMKNLGLAHLANGRHQDGLDLMEQAQWMAERYAGAESHLHAASACQLARVLLLDGDLPRARRVLGELPEAVFTRPTHWGDYCQALRQIAVAAADSEADIARQLAALAGRGLRGRNYRAELMSLQGVLALRRGQAAQAEALLATAHADKRAARSDTHYETLWIALRRAEALAALGDAAAATALRRSSLQALAQALGPDHPLVEAEKLRPGLRPAS